MKFCPYCGAGLKDDMVFCPKCGKPFEGEDENPHLTGKSAPQVSPATAATVSAPAVEAAPKKKKRGGLIAIIAVVAVLAIVGGLFASGAFAPKEEPVPTEEPVIPFIDDTESIAQASKSVVMLTCYDKDGEPYATGSGFAAFDDGVIVTNYHVIKDEVYRVKAQVEGGISFECPTVLAYDAEKDIAILKADRNTDLSLLPVGSANDLQKGAKVVAIGSPLGLMNSVSTGVFSGYVEDKAGSVLQFTAAISHGNSGGALFNDAGEVIGITFASLTEGQSLNLAVPIDDAKALYEYAGSQKAISIEDFYDTFDHTPPIPTYTVGYVLEHFEELDEQIFYMEGYVSSFGIYKNEDTTYTTELFLVDNETNVAGYTYIKEGYWWGFIDAVYKKESKNLENAKCVDIRIPDQALDKLNPKDKVMVQCQMFVSPEDYNYYGNMLKMHGAERISFTIFDFAIIQ